MRRFDWKRILHPSYYNRNKDIPKKSQKVKSGSSRGMKILTYQTKVKLLFTSLLSLSL